MYNNFDDLPDWAKNRIREFRPNDAEIWVYESVPALEGQSFLQVMNQGEQGVTKIREYLNRLLGKFFPGSFDHLE